MYTDELSFPQNLTSVICSRGRQSCVLSNLWRQSKCHFLSPYHRGYKRLLCVELLQYPNNLSEPTRVQVYVFPYCHCLHFDQSKDPNISVNTIMPSFRHSFRTDRPPYVDGHQAYAKADAVNSILRSHQRHEDAKRWEKRRYGRRGKIILSVYYLLFSLPMSVGRKHIATTMG